MNVLALCAGAAMLEHGLRLAVPSARTVCYVEREAFAAAHLVGKMQAAQLDEAPVWSDLRTFDGGSWRGSVDCVTAGFPCQPFSTAGKKLGAADERNAWPDVARIIREVRPRFVFLENVPDLLGGYVGQVFGDLAALGFDAEWGVFSAAEVGAPHLRKRLFILAAHPCAIGRGACVEDLQARESHATRRQLAIADAPRQRRVQGRTERPRRVGEPTPGSSSAETSDPHSRGQQSKRVGGLLDGERSPQRNNADRCDRTATNTSGTRLPGTERQQQLPTQSPWASDTMPQPAIRRVDDGVANRVDRLRLCGNGVVPQQAALAFTELWGRLS